MPESADLRYPELDSQALESLEGRILALLSESDFGQALRLLELRLTQTGTSLGLAGPYVLCLAAVGSLDRARAFAKAALEAIAKLTPSPRTEQLTQAVTSSMQLGEQ